MEPYDHRAIEEKWQKKWAEDGLYKTVEDKTKEKCYVLDMFPYPSGVALHVGHPKGYVATDVYTRYKRMKGFNILHPMGWDAFGLPAENYAIKNKVHPRLSVDKNIATYKAQLSKIGLNYDWDREINTTDPEYYKWTQWIFLQMFKKGLAYESHEPINWCPSCQTGLANEDLEDGKCERCGSVVEKKPMRQWVLKITNYADRLVDDLGELDWSSYVKEMQKSWIGRSQGLVFKHKVKDSHISFETFSAHFEMSYADTFIVIAPDHRLLAKLIDGVENEEEVRNKIEDINLKRLANKYGDGDYEGVFTGRYAINPLGGPDMPIWVGSFALADYGTGIIRCSAYDERDLAFATKYNIPLVKIEPVVDREKIAESFVNAGVARKVTMYRLRDWVFSRQRYWGEPIPLIHCGTCGIVAVPDGELPVKLPEVKHYEPTGTGESPLANIAEWVNVKCPKCDGPAKRETNTMPQWAGSSWYYLRYMDPLNTEQLVSKEKEKYWSSVDLYVGIGEHITRHMIYARFWHKFLYDIGVVSTKEPFAKYQKTGLILGADGRKMSKRWNNAVNPDDVMDKFGADAYRLYTLFLGPFAETVVWNDEAIIGPRRFLERVWKIVKNPITKTQGKILDIGKYIKKITSDIESLKFNTAVSELMKCLNEFENADVKTAHLEQLMHLLAPFAPHIADELWHELGHSDSIHTSSWPEIEPLVASSGDVQRIPIQVDGKVRDSVFVESGADEESVKKTALQSPIVAKWLKGKQVSKVVYVPGRILNIVTK